MTNNNKSSVWPSHLDKPDFSGKQGKYFIIFGILATSIVLAYIYFGAILMKTN